MKTNSSLPKFHSPLDFLPPKLVAHFKQIYDIKNLLQWQIECLLTLKPTIEESFDNIVIRAPTGAGKSLISDLLSLHMLTIKKKGAKVIYVVPYVSLLFEKYEKLQSLFSPLNLSVLNLLGNKPYSLFDKADIILCTIEKANTLIYGLIEKNELKALSMLVVDEVQFVGDEQRGALLEILIAKILYAQRYIYNEVQILAISATIDNFFDFVTWMKAKYYECSISCTNIEEYVKVGNKLLSSSGKVIKVIKEQSNDKYKICALVDLVLNKGPILIFSSSKFICEEIAKTLSDHKANEVNTTEFLKDAIEKAQLVESRMTNKVEWLLKGIACHHAGLLAEERVFIENLYRSLAVNILICTSTLAAGVNLPVSIVIIVGLTQGLLQISVSTYKQMRGRAGRTTFKGQCYIICREAELKGALKLINSMDVKNPVLSTLDKGNNSMRKLLLEGISLKCIKDNVNTYINFTLLNTRSYEDKALDEALKFLVEHELIVEKDLIATQLGVIIARSGHHIEEMLIAYWELQAANIKYLPCNKAFALYLISPVFWINEKQASWVHYLTYYKKHLDEHEDLKKTANYLSINEDYIIAWTQITTPDRV